MGVSLLRVLCSSSSKDSSSWCIAAAAAEETESESDEVYVFSSSLKVKFIKKSFHSLLFMMNLCVVLLFVGNMNPVVDFGSILNSVLCAP